MDNFPSEISMQRLREISVYDLLNCNDDEPQGGEFGAIVKSGRAYRSDGGHCLIYFTAPAEPNLLPLPPLVVIPDEGQRWVLVEYMKIRFTWIPMRLLWTMESSKEQVTKFFDLMANFLLISNTSLTRHVSDDFASFLYSQASKVKEEEQVVVLRVEFLKLCVESGYRPDYDENPQNQNHQQGPATEEFIRSALTRFEIGDDVVVESDHEDKGRCSICLEDFLSTQLVARMPCGDLFHDCCITEWLTTSGWCPMCQFEADCEYDDDDDDEDFDIPYTPSPATGEFIKSALSRFEIEDDVKEGEDDNRGPCVICFENFSHVRLVARMPCGHVFHDRCITRWLKTSGLCPLCKFEADCDDHDEKDDEGDHHDPEEFDESDGTETDHYSKPYFEEKTIIIIWDI